jgi:hypothetical protein
MLYEEDIREMKQEEWYSSYQSFRRMEHDCRDPDHIGCEKCEEEDEDEHDV